MCCCEKSTINGTAPIKMTSDTPAFSYPPNPPALRDGEVMLYDEPGRCNPGCGDSHAYHFCVTADGARASLLVRHGAGDERMEFGRACTLPILTRLDSTDRYNLFAAIFHSQSKAVRDAREAERMLWKEAAAEKRIKTRKQPSRGVVKVWIEPRIVG